MLAIPFVLYEMRFKVNRSTVYRYVNRAERGELKAKVSPGRSRKLTLEQQQALLEQVEAHSDDTPVEHAERFAAEQGVELAFSTVNLYCKRLGITRKKRAFVLENEMKRFESSG